ncbi:tannase and feruloyl esterase [Mycena maculata]|uniref:Carboxylic ester hydrolase n=1 Tax=Mycena maculata TaxID=230809 RepID=A0AAD7HCW4_9AGAR|nr:tannase and feruloyl esterase [Mycena maculata]
MEFAVGLVAKLLLTFGSLNSTWNAQPTDDLAHAKCFSLKTSLNLENTTILDVSYLPFPSKIAAKETCESTTTSVPLCRVQFHTHSSDTSVIHGEVWLPDEWYGRLMALGNRGLAGCIPYDELSYGSSLHFAAVGSNGGHDGDTFLPLLHHPEVLNDFSYRSVHVEAVIGKEIVGAYYGRRPEKSYYVGCSQGGRQGTQAALKFPEDFDGIIAGAPATDFNHLMHWFGMLSRYLGAPNAASSPSYIPLDSWKIIAKEVLNQCDGIDGVVDGIITEPDACNFRPEALLCSADATEKPCFPPPQVETLKKIYSPLYGLDGELVYPRYDPGGEDSPLMSFGFSGEFSAYAEQMMKYVVLNVTDYDVSQDYGLKNLVLLDNVNGGGISTFDGDFSAFRDRGGKFITYHGRADPVIPSGISKRLYDLISRTLGMPSLDLFYRLFLVPGMDHCTSGVGAARFGQAPGTETLNASSHSIILALVDWVEQGIAPDAITGTASDGAMRLHCRYPEKSVWDGSSFNCKAA